MIQPIGPTHQTPREEVELGGVQIPGGRIHAQRVPVSGGRNALRRANRSGIEEQLRKERRSVSWQVSLPKAPRKHFERRRLRGRVDLLAGRAPARPRSDEMDRACSPSRAAGGLAARILRVCLVDS